ncbi:MAG: prepilin-type N-terminal cleavage/methylation domain-containing protein [Terriglobia bacterium]
MFRKRQSCQRGLTLIELLIAFLLFTTAIVALSRLFGMGTQVNFRSRSKSSAVSLAKFQLEALKAQPFDNLVAGGTLPPNAPVAPYFDNLDANGQPAGGGSVVYTRQWRIDDTDIDLDGVTDLKQITVVVTFNGPTIGAPVRAQVTTIRARG